MQASRLIRFTVALTMAGFSAIAFAQAAASPSEATTWDIFAGASYARFAKASTTAQSYASRNATGFDVSISERPYEKYHWLGGTIETSGDYSKTTYTVLGASMTQAAHLYTLMGGPMVMVPRGRLQPFARVLFGDTFGYNAVTPASSGTLTSTTTRNFGVSLGGGVDVNVSRAWALRGQADWIDGHPSSTQTDGNLRASVGLAFKF